MENICVFSEFQILTQSGRKKFEKIVAFLLIRVNVWLFSALVPRSLPIGK